ncbi:ribbon-helix-helix domain-containing protein [Anabaena azotica]|uniref:ribbon-helix-helix domain-containing protein n=1 Tax=Anabaena azotica TaxID=197653 RepID=UPI0039A70DF6
MTRGAKSRENGSIKIFSNAVMTQGKRLNIYFTDEDDLKLYAEISTAAKNEKRSMSQMMKILVSDALANRQKQKELT